MWALVWLTRIPPIPQCEEISAFSSYSDRIYCAESLVRAGSPQDLSTALMLTTDWPRFHPEYDDAQQVVVDASEQLLVVAHRQVQKGHLEEAVALASQVPLDTPLRQTAQGLIYDWRQEWKAGAALEQALETNLKTRSWDGARENLQALKSLKRDYWLRDRYRYWQQRFQIEQQAWNQLNSARQLAASGRPEDLQQAIALAHQIHLGSHQWRQAQQEVEQWGQNLLAYGLQQWQLGDLAGAIAAVQYVPLDVASTPEAQALVRFSHAQRLAGNQNPTHPPSYGDLFRLREAIRTAAAIPDNSPLYAEAQAQLQTWQAQLQDLTQLRLAQSLTALGLESTYQTAMVTAAAVAPDRPQRLQAQSLIAYWRNQIQQIEDRPILREADRLAKPATIPALQSAMEVAAQIPQGRALRIEAQTRIADWRQEIQEIEDRPIIDEAIALADQGKLSDAITVAQKIQPERALYPRAQTLIQDWTRTIQIAEDQPIFNEAKDLAYEGKLTRAINLASQIAPGRALYDEVQHAISLWKAEREYIWSLRGESGSSSSSTKTEESSSSDSE
jgi:soluble cytochrome b562